MDKVSVIVPAYNVETYVHRAIESVMGQTYRNVELVIVDDGSKDNTWPIILSYAEKDERIVAIHQNNQGVSVARNTALNAATGKYVVFLDSDDWLEAKTIEYLVGLQKEYTDYLISGSAFYVYIKNGQMYKELQKQPEPLAVASAREALMNIGTEKFKLKSSCYKLFNLSTIDKLRFNTTIFHGEDGLFVFEYLQKCKGIVFSTEPLWNVLERPGSATTSPYNIKWLTAIDAAEKMLTYAADAEIRDSLILNIIDRTEIVEQAALKVREVDVSAVDYTQKKLKEYRKVFLMKRRSAKQYIKFFIYSDFPKWLLGPMVKSHFVIKRMRNGVKDRMTKNR